MSSIAYKVLYLEGAFLAFYTPIGGTEDLFDYVDTVRLCREAARFTTYP